ncbi:MAG TPA: peptide ABC transporter substrate-binding protein [Anaerolineales bacterium]|nr:peptide ABC transporter substrate-binding protein [Anaerolineales bacterium]
MRTKLFSVVALLMTASLILAACGGATPVVQTVIVGGEVQVVTATPGPAPEGPKVITGTFGAPGDVPTIDPALSTDTSSTTIVNATTVGLSYLNEAEATLGPGMAETWDISEDGLTYTFHLRQGITWVKWDGSQVVQVMDCAETPAPRPVTAHDFEYSIKRALAPETASDYAYVLAFAIAGASEYNAGEGAVEDVAVTAVDDYTLEIGFLNDAAYNANIVGLWTAHAVPRWLIEGDDCTEARGDRWTEPGFFQGYGPFTLKEWVHDSSITIIKNPFWPGTENIPVPALDEVTHLLALDEAAALAEYEAGNIDWSPVPSAEIDRIKADPVLSQEFRVGNSLCTYYYGFNTHAPFVDDARVRRALSMAIDRQSLIDNVTKGGQEPAQWFARPGLVAAPTMDTHPDLGIKYDPAAAMAELQSYLDEKGLTVDQLDITLMFNTSSGHQRIAEAIQQMWRDNLGLTVNLTNQEWQVFLDTIRDPVATPQIYRLGWCQDYPDANNFTREVFVDGGSANPSAGGGINWKPGEGNYDQFEEIVLQAVKERDEAARVELYAQAEEILVATDAVIAPIYWYTSVGVTKPYITRTYALTGHQDFTTWDTSK